MRLRRPNRTIAIALMLASAVAALALTGARRVAEARAAEAPPLTYVGNAVCAGCHQAQAKLWAGSHHMLAMDRATDMSVLGDFSGATFEHYGVRSRFFRREGKFMVETDGPDGKLAEFESEYTLGVYPLQQYLIAFPDGRLQAHWRSWRSGRGVPGHAQHPTRPAT